MFTISSSISSSLFLSEWICSNCTILIVSFCILSILRLSSCFAIFSNNKIFSFDFSPNDILLSNLLIGNKSLSFGISFDFNITDVVEIAWVYAIICNDLFK